MATRQPPGYLVSSRTWTGVGESFDCTASQDRGMLWWCASGESAIFNFEASHNESVWGIVLRVTASATQTGTAQLTGYFPYVRANVTWRNIRTEPTTATANLWVYWSPVM